MICGWVPDVCQCVCVSWAPEIISACPPSMPELETRPAELGCSLSQFFGLISDESRDRNVTKFSESIAYQVEVSPNRRGNSRASLMQR